MFWLKILRFGLLLVVALTTEVAWAHGGGTAQLTNAEAGPYWVSAWTQPDPLRVGQAHITVAVSEPGDSPGGRREAGSPILGALVQVELKPLDREGEMLAAAATHEGAANKIFYEADLDLPATGRWQVAIGVEGPEGAGSASFDTDVSAPSTFNWTWIGGLAVVVLAGVWLAQRYRSQKGGA